MNPGDVWNRLTVIREEGKNVLCQCECGQEKWLDRNHVRSGHTTSCGCYMREAIRRSKNKTHGMTGTPTYKSWSSAKKRCETPSDKDYGKYGGRGIIMCDRWRDSFENFLADMGVKPEGMTLERRDVNGPYSPGNCEWATTKTQNRNRRITLYVTHQGQTKPLAQWCDDLGLDYARTVQRIQKFGMSPDEAFIGTRYNAKLTVEQAAAILVDPRRLCEIARDFNCSLCTVWNIKNGKSWKNSIARFLSEKTDKHSSTISNVDAVHNADSFSIQHFAATQGKH
jgi:hypothetical protein